MCRTCLLIAQGLCGIDKYCEPLVSISYESVMHPWYQGSIPVCAYSAWHVYPRATDDGSIGMDVHVCLLETQNQGLINKQVVLTAIPFKCT